MDRHPLMVLMREVPGRSSVMTTADTMSMWKDLNQQNQICLQRKSKHPVFITSSGTCRLYFNVFKIHKLLSVRRKSRKLQNYQKIINTYFLSSTCAVVYLAVLKLHNLLVANAFTFHIGNQHIMQCHNLDNCRHIFPECCMHSLYYAIQDITYSEIQHCDL